MATTQTAITNARSRQQWAEIIGADWRQSIESIIQTGRDLIAAKSELPHGEFMKMVESELPFKRTLADDLMRVANHPQISNYRNSGNLPATFSVLVELASLSEEQFLDAQEKGLITPDLKVKPARSIARAYSKPEGDVVGGAQHMLPSVKEAREIARATGRFVAAADGNIYSGSTEEESTAYRNKLNEGFRLLEAIQTLSEAPEAGGWFKSADRHWFVDFRPGAIDDARAWLASLKEAMGVVDA